MPTHSVLNKITVKDQYFFDFLKLYNELGRVRKAQYHLIITNYIHNPPENILLDKRKVYLIFSQHFISFWIIHSSAEFNGKKTFFLL